MCGASPGAPWPPGVGRQCQGCAAVFVVRSALTLSTTLLRISRGDLSYEVNNRIETRGDKKERERLQEE